MDYLKEIFEQNIAQITNPDARALEYILNSQRLCEYQRFVDELPILEAVLFDGSTLPQDLLDMNIIICRSSAGNKGRRHIEVL